MKTRIALYAVLLPALVFLSCRAKPDASSDEKGSDYLYATLWYQRSQEYKANVLAQYKLAAVMLDKALLTASWTAAPAEQTAHFEHKPPAIVLDIDETVLDNSPFAGWLVDKGIYYNAELRQDWDRWILSATARALPGVVDFVNHARSRHVRVFYISDREASQEEATRKNLQAAGVVVDEDIDVILLKNEKPGWGSKKGVRRSLVAEKYRILLLIGDNLGDFVDQYKTPYQARDEFILQEKYKELWGERWIVLPNPIYGSWEEAGYGYDYHLTRGQIRKRMKEHLIKWDGK